MQILMNMIKANIQPSHVAYAILKLIDKTTTHLSVSLEKLAESKLTSKYISRSRRG